MSRPVPFCGRTIGPLPADPDAARLGLDATPRKCIGSRCSDYLPASDNTPTANLMVCGRNPKAPLWVDPAAEESK